MAKIEDLARDYVAQAASMFAKGEAITSILLRKKGHTSDNPLEFNNVHGTIDERKWVDDYCYLVKIWVDEDDDKIYCDLYDYDSSKILECVCLSEDNKTKWATIIEYLI